MKRKYFPFVIGLGLLAACSEDFSGAGQDDYFATNVGRSSGYAKAFAVRCPSIEFREEILVQHRVAICESTTGTAQNCALPQLNAAHETVLANTLASFANMSDAQVCTYARGLAQSDTTLSNYLTGLRPVTAATPAPEPEPEPKPEEETF